MKQSAWQILCERKEKKKKEKKNWKETARERKTWSIVVKDDNSGQAALSEDLQACGRRVQLDEEELIALWNIVVDNLTPGE